MMSSTLTIIACHLLLAESRMLSNTLLTQDTTTNSIINEDKKIKLESTRLVESLPDDLSGEYVEVEHQDVIKKPCAVMILSNSHSPSMQSLIRKYRYNAHGILIPDSVKYFMKVPQGHMSSPVLVPLNDKAFSPLGGFIRYYKEVPPIPQAW